MVTFKLTFVLPFPHDALRQTGERLQENASDVTWHARALKDGTKVNDDKSSVARTVDERFQFLCEVIFVYQSYVYEGILT